MNSDGGTRDNAQRLDAKAIRSLTHPFRLELLGLLRQHGPSTSTKLAALTGQSSGLTSYHLRQLADAGLIADSDPMAGGRERWWQAVANAHRVDADVAGDDLTEEYQRQVVRAYARRSDTWILEQRSWPAPWQEASELSDWSLSVTLDEVADFKRDLTALIGKYTDPDPAKQDVAVQIQLFPVEIRPSSAEDPDD